MTIDYLTELDITFENGLKLFNTEFSELEIIESCFALPIVTLKMNLIDSKRFGQFYDSTYFDIELTLKENKNDKGKAIKFRALLLGQRSPQIAQNKTYVVRGMFFLEEFTQKRFTEVYTGISITEILQKIPTSIKLVADSFDNTDTFYHFNTNWWDFLLNYFMPYLKTNSSGIPLMGLILRPEINEIKIIDTAMNREPDFKVSVKGSNGVYEYESLSMDTEFDDASFRLGRMHSLVMSSYTKSEYISYLSPFNQIMDMPLMFDNGNCTENHTVKPIENTATFVNTPTYKISFAHSLNPIRLLDRVDVTTSEEKVSGRYYITKVITKVSTKVERTFSMKGL